MKWVERIEAFIVWAMVIMLLIAVVLSTVALGRTLLFEILDPPFLLIEPKTLFHSFGFFLISLIGLELLKVMKLHLSHHSFKPELVIEVAIIALCNKVVTLDVKDMPPQTILGLAALVLALSAGYYVFTKVQPGGEN